MSEEDQKQHQEATPEKKYAEEYIELRIPRFSRLRIPFLGVIGLMLLSFVAGYFGHQFASGNTVLDAKTQMVTDLPSAFTYYAKKLGIDEKKFATCYTDNKYLGSVQADMKDGTTANLNATPTFFINGQQLVGALPFDTFKQMIEQKLTGAPLPTTEPSETPTPPQIVAKGHLPPLGNPSAKVVVVEFSDFQCPFCERFFTATYPQLKKDYIDTGKVVFYYRHFPLTSIHPSAEPAALASECANEQGKFWQFHDLLFQSQPSWVNLPATTQTIQ